MGSGNHIEFLCKKADEEEPSGAAVNISRIPTLIVSAGACQLFRSRERSPHIPSTSGRQHGGWPGSFEIEEDHGMRMVMCPFPGRDCCFETDEVVEDPPALGCPPESAFRVLGKSGTS